MIGIGLFLGFIFLIFFYFYLTISEKKGLKKLKENYNEDDDRSKQGERARTLNGRTAKEELGISGLSESKGHSILSPTEVSDTGKTSYSTGESSRLVGLAKQFGKK